MNKAQACKIYNNISRKNVNFPVSSSIKIIHPNISDCWHNFIRHVNTPLVTPFTSLLIIRNIHIFIKIKSVAMLLLDAVKRIEYGIILCRGYENNSVFHLCIWGSLWGPLGARNIIYVYVPWLLWYLLSASFANRETVQQL